VKRLIINADDFGFTSGVNRAIVELHRHGILTSATLMARASATDEAIEQALGTPALGVGCHVVLVDGSPITSVELLPCLATAEELSPTLGAFLVRTYTGRATGCNMAQDIETEASAQISKLQRSGIHLTHIDTHKHTHMFPKILRPVLRAARAAGICAIRNPYEPTWSVRATPGAPMLRRAQVQLLHTLQSSFRRIVAEEGFVTTDGAIGVLATGTLDSTTLASLLSAMPDGTWELVTHPGYNDTSLARVRTRLLASREIEYQALKNTSISQGIKLIHFGQLEMTSHA
jgi:predicted glycoside hydrolase/deacetylase ChbG (UPF0249 family)